MRSFVFLLIWCATILLNAPVALAKEPGKATDGKEVVMNKIYPKEGKLSLELSVGTMLNQSYVQTILFGGSVAYFPNEYWGLGVTALLGKNKDNSARECIESFYNDPKEEVVAECRTSDASNGIANAEHANMGPAYVPIREIEQLVTADFLWNPVYGKQIVLLSQTSYFDLQIGLGGGLVFSKFYAQRLTIRDSDRPSRSAVVGADSEEPNVGVSPDASDARGVFYGKDGRPDPESTASPVLDASLKQRFRFAKRFSFSLEFKTYMLLGGPSAIEPFFTLGSGLGVWF